MKLKREPFRKQSDECDRCGATNVELYDDEDEVLCHCCYNESVNEQKATEGTK